MSRTHDHNRTDDARSENALPPADGGKPAAHEHGGSRRAFLAQAGSAAAGALSVGLIDPKVARADDAPLGGIPPGQTIPPLPPPGGSRASQAQQIRILAARNQRFQPYPAQTPNGDEAAYGEKFASFSKGLPHNALGHVDLVAYAALLNAINTGSPAAFESIPLAPPLPQRRKLVNPQCGLAFDMVGADSHHLAQPAAPTFNSAEEAGEIVENYWMALTRDVPFADYGSNPLTLAAVADLNALSVFYGPRDSGFVTTGTLFRGLAPGELNGPYISQFLWRPAPFGVQYVEQRMRTRTAGVDYMTTYADWLSVQNGYQQPLGTFEPGRRYITNGRDLSEWVHIDVLFQAYFNAMLILKAAPDPDLTVGGVGCPFNPGNPYLSSQTQDAFGTFGPPHCAEAVCEVATRALKAVWYQKWFVHRRLRPEVFAGRIHNHINGAFAYPIHADALNSAALTEVFNQYGTYLLPMAFPEGSPLHPAYGAGHATVAGACVTLLKAFFDETHVIPNPMIPDPGDPTQLIPYVGPPLTVGGELNKLAQNVATGRNIAGVHWRSDAWESMLLGEAVTISMLRDYNLCYNEVFSGFSFTKFDGTPVTI